MPELSRRASGNARRGSATEGRPDRGSGNHHPRSNPIWTAGCALVRTAAERAGTGGRSRTAATARRQGDRDERRKTHGGRGELTATDVVLARLLLADSLCVSGDRARCSPFFSFSLPAPSPRD